MAGQGEALNLQELALEFLQGTSGATEGNADPTQETQEVVEHPAWQAILDAVPAEYHSALTPTLQEWDKGVSRRFQKIHDEYAPLKEFEDVDPHTLKEAVDVYTQLLNDPAATWETIGRAFNLSPQGTSQSASEDEDFDGLELPDALRARLAKIDDHDRVLELVTSELLERRQASEEEYEDAQLRDYLDNLKEEYGEYDEDYVTSLIAVGVDGDEAVERYRAIVGQGKAPTPSSEAQRDNSTPEFDARLREALPKVMSSTGGVPASTGREDLSKLSNQDTRALVENILRLAAQE